ncbi:MAG: VPLPA-CTERM sorting domain-containing protein [Pseudomonadota bacterium]
MFSVASAQAVTIDAFDTDQAEITSSATGGADPGSVVSEASPITGSIATARQITVDATPTADAVTNGNNVSLSAGVVGDTFNIDAIVGSVGTVLLSYGTDVGIFVPGFSAQDLTGAGAFDQITIDATALLGSITVDVTITDTDGTVATVSEVVSGGPTSVDLAFTAFLAAANGGTGGLDLTDVNGFDVLFSLNQGGSSASFDIIQSTSVVTPVPLPASGVLLLAGMGGIALMRRRA